MFCPVTRLVALGALSLALLPATAQPLAPLVAAVHAAGGSAADAASLRGAIPEEAYLFAGDAAAGDQFGVSVALSGDYAIVGAWLDDDAGTSSGAAYVFVRAGGTWGQQAKLTADDAAEGDAFGFAVALDGARAVIGALYDDDGGSDSGAAYVFVREGDTWTQEAKLTASDAAAGDRFGVRVALAGGRALVGAYRADGVGTDSGAAYVFAHDGSAWTQEARLTPAAAAAGDEFGFAVVLADTHAVIGAWLADAGAPDTGAAFVFRREGTVWTEEARLTADVPATGDLFGGAVALSGDRVLVGARATHAGPPDSGAAYLFRRDAALWVPETRLVASDGTAGDEFGSSVALDGDYAVVGAWRDGRLGPNSGSAYLFVNANATWTEVARLVSSDTDDDDRFGVSVALDGDGTLVGAYGRDHVAEGSGAAYLFRIVLPTARETDAPAERATVALFPNPALTALQIRATLPRQGFARIVVSDMLGRRLMVPFAQVAQGEVSVTVPTRGLAPGVYTVVVEAAGEVQTHRFTVGR